LTSILRSFIVADPASAALPETRGSGPRENFDNGLPSSNQGKDCQETETLPEVRRAGERSRSLQTLP